MSRERFHSGGTYFEKKIISTGKEMRAVTQYYEPFVEYDPSRARGNSAVSLESLRLYFVAPQSGGDGRAFGYTRTFYYFRPSLPAAKSQPPQPTAVRVGP